MTTTDTAAVHPLAETHRETLEQARQALAEEDVVVGEDNPWGTLAHPSIMG